MINPSNEILESIESVLFIFSENDWFIVWRREWMKGVRVLDSSRT
jgi:hypothetical protein